jgi:hypothetical protein
MVHYSPTFTMITTNRANAAATASSPAIMIAASRQKRRMSLVYRTSRAGNAGAQVRHGNAF